MNRARNEREQGFTFVELMVVLLIIAILAAIAIPVFLQQREKAWAAQVHSALKNVNFAIEAHGTDQGGDYSALDGGDSTSSNAPFQLVEDQGYRSDPTVDLMVSADQNTYCVTAEHSLLPVTHEWQTATFSSAGGAPAEANLC
ncbi:MAG TPA: prepilin-type N-terminal cleavage/methylation domain-containing protein [Trueperaceae bacterium]|nr:prepilin-type N-terminal cleavage/methylation domain-containing protein [Trueperaceae bacterium]